MTPLDPINPPHPRGYRILTMNNQYTMLKNLTKGFIAEKKVFFDSETYSIYVLCLEQTNEIPYQNRISL